MIRQLHDAQTDLAPYVDRLHRRVKQALQEFVTDYAQQRSKLSGRSASSIIHDLMVWHLRDEFPKGNMDQVSVITTKQNLDVVMVGDKYRIKLKKLTRGLRTMNIQTQAVMDFLQQGTQVDLIPAPTNLHLGWRPTNAAELITAQIWITCPNGERRPHWKMELLPVAPSAIVPHPTVLTPANRKTRVRPKPELVPPIQKKDDGSEEDK